MTTLSREDLLKKEELEVKPVKLGKDEIVYVRQMTAFERDKFEQTLRQEVKDDKGNTDFKLALDDFRAKLAVCTLCDEKGKLIMEREDWPLLSHNMSAYRMEKIITVAQKLNAITEEDKELMLKNSEVGQADNSNSASAKN